MPRFLLEVPHENSKKSCDLSVKIFKSTGSHFLTNADFGCLDNVHKAWINIEAKSKSEAARVVPPTFRNKTKVIKINKFALEKVDKILKPRHK